MNRGILFGLLAVIVYGTVDAICYFGFDYELGRMYFYMAIGYVAKLGVETK